MLPLCKRTYGRDLTLTLEPGVFFLCGQEACEQRHGRGGHAGTGWV